MRCTARVTALITATFHLTVPGIDTESYYIKQADWQKMGPIKRGLYTFNQTMAGRLAIGPVLRLCLMVSRETRRVQQKDYSHLPHWALHLVALAGLFWFISGVCKFPWWQYCLLVGYPGLSLSLLRAFTEHRAAEDSQERTASVESNAVLGIMYLYNNLHVAHHLKPTMAWYDIPKFYRENRAELLKSNAEFVYKGYGELAQRYFFVPVFSPVHPRPLKQSRAILATAVGNMLEWYDFTVYAYFAGYIAKSFFPAGDNTHNQLLQAFLVFGLGFVVRPLGAIIIGNYADRAGRKAALTLTILLMGAGTALIAFSPTFQTAGMAAPLLLLLGRLLQGFSAGGEIGGATAYLLESGSVEHRGRIAAWLEASMGMSNILGALVAYAVNRRS